MSSTDELEAKYIREVLSQFSTTSCTPKPRGGAHIEVHFAARRMSFTLTILNTRGFHGTWFLLTTHAVHLRYCDSSNGSPPWTAKVGPLIRRPLTIVTTARLPLVAAIDSGMLTVP